MLDKAVRADNARGRHPGDDGTQVVQGGIVRLPVTAVGSDARGESEGIATGARTGG